jgi:hypothetical protein
MAEAEVRPPNAPSREATKIALANVIPALRNGSVIEDKAFIAIFGPHTEPSAELVEHRAQAGFKVWSIRLLSGAETVARWARRGNWNRLAEYVARGGRIAGEIRKFLAAGLRREVRNPNNCAASFAGSAGVEGVLNRVLFVLSLEQALGRHGATSAAAEKFNVSRRSIERALAKAEAAAKLLIELRDLQLETRRCVPRYAVSHTALTPHFMPSLDQVTQTAN